MNISGSSKALFSEISNSPYFFPSSQIENKLIFLSLIFAIFSLILSYLVVPFTQDKARSFIRDSNLDFFPSLIKPKKFIDTVENLTIFLNEKKDNSMKKILIKDSRSK